MASVSLTNIIFTSIILYIFAILLKLLQNYQRARKIGLPIVFVPVDQSNILWIIISPIVRPLLKRYLPRFIYNRIVICIFGHEFHEKLEPFKNFVGGQKTYTLITLRGLEIWTCDPDVSMDVLRRPKDFSQLEIANKMMSKFGSNVLTTSGAVWARQRKIIASVINEKISGVVFDESVRQAAGFIEEFGESKPGDIGSRSTKANRVIDGVTYKTFDMVKKITIHVLSRAGMGVTRPWRDDGRQIRSSAAKADHDEDSRLKFDRALQMILANLVSATLVPEQILSHWPFFLPGAREMRDLASAVRHLPRMFRDMLGQEAPVTDSFHGSSDKEPSTKINIIRNLFIFNAAGFDTSANALSFPLVVLAAYPHWQEWLFEEIDQIVPEDSDASMEYSTIFPKAIRTLAFMLEVLRLFPPVIHIGKTALCGNGEAVQLVNPMKKNGESAVTTEIPSGVVIYINSAALHMAPEVWRDLNPQDETQHTGHRVQNRDASQSGIKASGRFVPDEELFRPSRWINHSDNTIFQPPRGSYLPWSAGPLTVQGKKWHR
ncbi:hypothetical protein CPC735_052040 [Coccidioides posadasii C735 delta SOWgp]|uniref:Cytochrome P450 n=2 Tax=Coccidioides posadasii TaxID=199306 RepID=A0A0J6I202_COCPO|nr:hypothetical protein CPC735_052040 [Coccidioides posadasii C735 delta SOWgp]EER23834.1 hypothetical protein CPC735_052040 [Coccidioides posadasii C735 delta SOWgp]KMM65332.1 hypothetical protein CPAG_01683 [Coccidioides posadasii RMSCC 3488]|eukprot:XP_003065979.1 hypothetical protein CPC735_052040 [Coccidioides posadasii C735 delta SOWgp]